MREPERSAHRRASVSLFRTAGWLQGEFDTCLRPYDLSSQQLRALSLLANMPDGVATVGELRDGMTDPNSNISRLLNKLLEKGRIEKHRKMDDQRVVHVRITAAGREVCAQAQRALMGQASVWSRISADEAEILAELLDKLRG